MLLDLYCDICITVETGCSEGCLLLLSRNYGALQVNRVCIWQCSSEVSCDKPPSSSSSLVEPVFLCEQEMAADTTDLCFLDEERLFGSFSNGCVMLFRFCAAMQVDSSIFFKSQVVTYQTSSLLLPPFPLSLSGTKCVLCVGGSTQVEGRPTCSLHCTGSKWDDLCDRRGGRKNEHHRCWRPLSFANNW